MTFSIFSYHGKEFLVHIGINDLENIPIRCILYQTAEPVLTDETESYEMDALLDDLPEIPPRSWKLNFNEPIFEEQREELYMLPRHALPEVIINERRHIAASSEYNISIDEVKKLIQKYSEWKDKRDNVLFSN